MNKEQLEALYKKIQQATDPEIKKALQKKYNILSNNQTILK